MYIVVINKNLSLFNFNKTLWSNLVELSRCGEMKREVL